MSQRRHDAADPEPVGLTLEDLKSFRYLQPIFDKFDELKKENSNITWDDPEFQEARNLIFNGMSDREKTAYNFSFGYPQFEVRERDPQASAAETSDDEGEGFDKETFKDSLQFSIHYGVAGKFCVLFDHEEMTDEYIDDRFHRPFLQQEGTNIFFANARFPEETTGIVIKCEASAQRALQEALHGHIVGPVLSVLKKTEVQQDLTRGVFSFLKKKGAIHTLEGEADIAEPNFNFKPRYYAYGGEFLDGGGLIVKPDIVVCYEAYLDGERYSVLGVTAFGEVKRPSIKRNFKFMQRSLRDRNQEFLDAIAARMTSGGALPSDLGNQEFLDAVAARMTCDGNLPTDLGSQEILDAVAARMAWGNTNYTDLGRDFQAAVELYAIITKLVTSGVHMGVPRVMLMDSVNFLLIELNENFHLEEPIHKSLQFPKLVSCHYRWLNRSDFFLRLTICSFLSPTLEYARSLATFRSPVQMNLLSSITELLRSVAENLRRIPFRMNTTENGGDTGSTSRKGEIGIGSETLSAMRAKLVEAMAEGEIGALTSTTPEAHDDSGAASSNDTLFSDYATSTDATAPISTPLPLKIEGKLMYPEEYKDKNFPTTDGVEAFDNRAFSVRDDTFKYPFYVNLGESIKKYVCSDRGLNSQVSLVNPDVFLAYIPQLFMFNNAPHVDSAILKVYDPFWFNNDYYRDPEVAFNRYGPRLQKLCKNELVIYEKIVALMGEVVPLIYSYGYMVDVSIMVGQLYKRFVGPYILMQQFERSDRFKEAQVDLEFVETRIIPQFKRLHELEVVHNDFKWENIIVTEDRDVKIIDFSLSFISSNEDDYKQEIERIYDNFGYSIPGTL